MAPRLVMLLVSLWLKFLMGCSIFHHGGTEGTERGGRTVYHQAAGPHSKARHKAANTELTIPTPMVRNANLAVRGAVGLRSPPAQSDDDQATARVFSGSRGLNRARKYPVSTKIMGAWATRTDNDRVEHSDPV